MKRDDDYVRELMFEFEVQPDWLILLPEMLSMSAEERRKQHHVHLLVDANMVVPVGRGTYRLTNHGHDFLAAVRDEGIWARTKAAVAETGGSATLEMLKALASGYIRKQITDRTGIEF